LFISGITNPSLYKNWTATTTTTTGTSTVQGTKTATTINLTTIRTTGVDIIKPLFQIIETKKLDCFPLLRQHSSQISRKGHEPSFKM
jgi:hypothetical protein